MNKNIGKNLKLYCRLRGWTRDDIANRMGVSTPIITWIFQGYRMSVNTIIKLEEVTHIPLKTWERKMSLDELKELAKAVVKEWGEE